MNLPLLLLPGLLLEAIFYFLPVWPPFRERFGNLPPYLQAGLIWLSGIAPVLLLNGMAGEHPREIPLLMASLAIVCGWFLFLPRRPLVDVLLLVLLTTLILSSWFQGLYPSPRLAGLPKLLWSRIGISVFLFLRRFPVPGLGFWPTRQEWTIGARHFAIFFALLLPIGLYFKILRVQLPKVDLWILPFLTIGVFLGFFLFVAWGEEFLVRGVLQSVLVKELGRWPGILLASLCFGAVHLSYRNYPNWRFAALSAAAGVFYGLAFDRARSLRAALVTHSLVNTVWTVIFSRSL